ncbi:uncharacterized protein LOC133398481 [Phycodurus eques]|uniref:uncharacterized protein LOC133398481 n=1 Tax=Phycodurus eques TaxID=693459 RepID=UPI002ACD7732|nr:uncharacterized protein LOC133398481 [Phycodurus eques]
MKKPRRGWSLCVYKSWHTAPSSSVPTSWWKSEHRAMACSSSSNDTYDRPGALQNKVITPRCVLCGNDSLRSAWVVGSSFLGHCCFPSPLSSKREVWIVPDGIYLKKVAREQGFLTDDWLWLTFAELATKGIMTHSVLGEPLVPLVILTEDGRYLGRVYPLLRMAWRLASGGYRFTYHMKGGSCIAVSPETRPPPDQGLATTTAADHRSDRESRPEAPEPSAARRAPAVGSITPTARPPSPGEVINVDEEEEEEEEEESVYDSWTPTSPPPTTSVVSEATSPCPTTPGTPSDVLEMLMDVVVNPDCLDPEPAVASGVQEWTAIVNAFRATMRQGPSS